MVLMTNDKMKALLSAMLNGLLEDSEFTRKDMCDILEDLADEFRY